MNRGKILCVPWQHTIRFTLLPQPVSSCQLMGTVQQQIGRVSDQIEAQKDTGEKVEKLVQKLLDLQLRRSGGLSP